MADTLIDNLTKDISNAVTVKLAALGANLAANEKTAVDWGALATQAKNAITSQEMGNILRQANQRGLRLGGASAIVNGIRGGLEGAVQGYKNSGPGAWNKIKGVYGGGAKGQLKGMAKGFTAGYGAGAGGSIIGDALTGAQDMQALKGMFGGTPATAVPAGNNAAFNALNSGDFTWGKVTGNGIQQTPRKVWN